MHAERGEYLLFLGRMSAGQGLPPRRRGRPRRPACRSRSPGRCGSRPSGSTSRRTSRRTSATGSSTSARRATARRSPAPERARDALPDRVGGAVRPRHDRVDGLRDAGDRHALGRRARGDRARPLRDRRGRLPRDGRRARRRRTSSSRSSAAARSRSTSPRSRMVEDYVAAYEAVARGPRPPALSAGERLLEVGDEVVRRLEPDREADEVPRRRRRRPPPVEACVMRAGTSIRLSTPPRLSASVQTFVRVTSASASSSEPARGRRSCRRSRASGRAAISCPGWSGRPG